MTERGSLVIFIVIFISLVISIGAATIYYLNQSQKKVMQQNKEIVNQITFSDWQSSDPIYLESSNMATAQLFPNSKIELKSTFYIPEDGDYYLGASYDSYGTFGNIIDGQIFNTAANEVYLKKGEHTLVVPVHFQDCPSGNLDEFFKDNTVYPKKIRIQLRKSIKKETYGHIYVDSRFVDMMPSRTYKKTDIFKNCPSTERYITGANHWTLMPDGQIKVGPAPEL